MQNNKKQNGLDSKLKSAVTNHPAPLRMKIDYSPGFHAYLGKPISHLASQFKIVKCWAKKADIIRIGFPQAGFSTILAVAISKITRK